MLEVYNFVMQNLILLIPHPEEINHSIPLGVGMFVCLFVCMYVCVCMCVYVCLCVCMCSFGYVCLLFFRFLVVYL